MRPRQVHATTPMHVHIRKTSTPLIFLQMAEKNGGRSSQSVRMHVTLGHYHMPITEHSRLNVFLKSQEL